MLHFNIGATLKKLLFFLVSLHQRFRKDKRASRTNLETISKARAEQKLFWLCRDKRWLDKVNGISNLAHAKRAKG